MSLNHEPLSFSDKQKYHGRTGSIQPVNRTYAACAKIAVYKGVINNVGHTEQRQANGRPVVGVAKLVAAKEPVHAATLGDIDQLAADNR